MTDESNGDEFKEWPALDLSKEGIARRLNEVGAKDNCPSCGKSAWDAFGINGEWLVSLDVFIRKDTNEEDHTANRHIPAVGLVCQNCGFLRLHGARLFVKSDDDNPGGDDEFDEGADGNG